MNINDFYNAKELVAYHSQTKALRDSFLGDSVFPPTKSNEMSLTWVKGYNAKNVVLAPAALDTKAVIRSQQPAKKVETELPFFKESVMFTEQMRRKVINDISRYGEKIALDMMEPIYRQYAQLVDGALVQMERMRMALLSLGGFHIRSNADTGQSVQYRVNYDPDGSWRANNYSEIIGTSSWTAANSATSDPVNDLLDAIQVHAEKNGAVITKILMNSATLRGITNSESVRKLLQPLGGLVSRRAVRDLIESETEAKLVIYDQTFNDEFNVGQKFYPDGYVSLLPDGAVGQSVYGTTPTEYDLLDQQEVKNNIAVTEEGVAVQTVLHKDPVNIETIVSASCMPSFENMDKVYVLKGF